MKKIAFAFLATMAVLSFTGCKKKAGTAEAIAKMESFKNDVCKCADKACLEKVDAAMTEWQKSMADKGDKNAKPSEDDMKKISAISEEMSKCRMKLMTPPAADTPPAAPSDPAAGGTAPAAGSADPAAAGSAAPAAGSADAAGSAAK